MRIWMFAPLGLAMLAAGCSGMQEQRSSSTATADTPAAGEVGAVDRRGQMDAPGQPDPASPTRVEDDRDAIAWQQRRVEPQVGQAGGAASEQARPEPVPYNTEPTQEQDRSATAPSARTERAAPADDLTNEEVREAQTALRDLGFYDGEIDGLYGPRTISAVGDFQAQQNMPRTRALDDRTQEQLQTQLAQRETGGQKDAQQAAGGGQTGTTGTAPAQPGSPGTMAASESGASSYRSVSRSQDFSGPIAGGYQTQELMGKQVVGPNGQTVGEIADLLIGQDDQASHALVEVAGSLGIGTDKQVAIPIDRLDRRGDRFATQLSPDELEAAPSYSQQGDRWTVEQGGGSRN